MRQRQRKEVGKMAAFVFVLPEAAFTSQNQTPLSKSPPTPTAVTEGLSSFVAMLWLGKKA